MVLVIDNYDSFTYNLVQYCAELKERVRVVRNDRITADEIVRLRPKRIIISPGPGRPENAGISCEVIRRCAGAVPILGVCLGHQAIGFVYGGRIVRAKRLMHGKTSRIRHTGAGIFRGLPQGFVATRYHSLIVDRGSVPDCLEITAWTDEDEVMGLQHRKVPVFGVQFHPESILTDEGKNLLKNFLDIGSNSAG